MCAGNVQRTGVSGEFLACFINARTCNPAARAALHSMSPPPRLINHVFVLRREEGMSNTLLKLRSLLRPPQQYRLSTGCYLTVDCLEDTTDVDSTNTFVLAAPLFLPSWLTLVLLLRFSFTLWHTRQMLATSINSSMKRSTSNEGRSGRRSRHRQQLRLRL